MPKTIDERVVSMQFDNKNFERNVAQSMNTLDKLKNKLNFNGASKGLEELDSNVKKFSTNPMVDALSAVDSKFSILKEVGIGALRSLGEEAVATAKKFINSLGSDNIGAGWEKFGRKTTSVATLSSQGFELEEVNEQLERLNWFTDETSYNFTDMVDEIGKFTAAGQGLTESVTAMQGIASWAALSGQNAQVASRAMYQLSQAMGSGVMRKDDYRSIQTANMDTKEFRQRAIDAAIALGTLQEVSDGVYKSLVEDVEDGEFTVEQFAEHLTKDKWFTSDVMMAVFTDYGKAANTIMAYVDKYADDTEHQISTASEAMDDIEEKARKIAEEMVAAGQFENVDKAMDAALMQVSLDEIREIPEIYDKAIEHKDKYNQSLIDDYNATRKNGQAMISTIEEAIAAGLNPITEIDDALIDMGYGLDTFALKALRAGQEARTFEDVINSVKDAVSTGWMSTFENIFGNYDEAKKLWTDLANELYDVFAEKGNERNKMLKEWKSLGGRDLLFANTDEETGAFWNLFYALTDVINAVKEAFREIFPPMTAEKLYNITERFKEFTERIRLSDEQIENLKTVVRGLASGFDLILNGVVAVIKGFKPLTDLLGKGDGTFKNMILRFFEWLTATDKAAKEMNKFEAITTNVAKVVQKIIDIVSGFIGVIKDLSDAIASLFTSNTEHVDGFGSKLEERFSKLSDILHKFLDKFSVLGEAFKKVFDFIGGILKILLDQVTITFDNFVNSLKNEEGNLDAGKIAAFIETLIGFISGVGIQRIITIIKDSSKRLFGFKNLVDPIAGVFEELSGVFRKAQDAIKVDSIMKIAKAIAILVAALFILTLIDADKLKSATTAITTLFADLIGSFVILEKTGSKSLKSANMVAIGVALEEMAIALLIVAAAMTIISKLSWSDIGKSVVSMYVAINTMTDGINNIKEPKGVVKKSFSLILVASSLTILGAAMRIMAKMDWEGIAKSLIGIFSGISIMVVGLNDIKDTNGLVKKAFSLILVASALTILGAAMRIIAKIDWEGIAKGLITLFFGVNVMVHGLNDIKDTQGLVKKAFSLILVSTSLVILASSMKILASIDAEGILKGIVSLFAGINFMVQALNDIKEPKGLVKKAFSLILVSTSLVILASSMKILASIDAEGILKGIVSLFAGINFMVQALNDIKEPKGLVKKAFSLILVSTSLVILASSMKILSSIDTEGILKGIVSLFAGINFMVQGLNDIKKIEGLAKKAFSLILVSTSLVILASSMKTLASINAEGILKGIISLFAGINFMVQGLNGIKEPKGLFGKALSLILVSTAMVILSASFNNIAKLSWDGVIKSIVSLIAAITLITVSLNTIKPPTTDKAVSLSIVLGSFMGLAKYMQTFENISPGAMLEGIVSMAAAMNMVVASLNHLKGEDLIKKSAALLIVSGSLMIIAGSLALLATVGWAGLLVGVVAMLAVFGAIFVGAKLLGKSSVDIGKLTLSILQFSLAMAVFGASMIPVGAGLLIIGFGLTAIGRAMPALAEGMAVLVPVLLDELPKITSGVAQTIVQCMPDIVAAILAVINGILDVVRDAVPNLVSTLFEVIRAILDELSNNIPEIVSVIFNLLMNVLGQIVANLPTITEQIFTIILTLLDALVQYGPQIIDKIITFIIEIIHGLTIRMPDIVQAVFDFIQALFGGVISLVGQLIGTLFGEIVEGFATAIADGLPHIGEKLSQFSGTIQPFLDMTSGISEDSMRGVQILAATILAIVAAEFISGITDFLSIFGGSTSEEFGEKIVEFGRSMVEFAEVTKDIDAEQVTKSAIAAKALADFANNLPKEGGLWQKIAGTGDLAKFADELKAFAPAFVEYANKIVEIKDMDAIAASATAAKSLADFANNLPKHGGIWQEWVGDSSLKTFADELNAFAPALVDYATKVKGLDGTVIENSTKAATCIKEFATNLPPHDGLVQKFTGDATLSSFAEEMKAFAPALVEYANTVKDLDVDVVTKSTAAAETLSALEAGLPDQGGVVSWFAGDNTLETFAKELPNLAIGLKGYADNLGTNFDSSIVTSSVAAAQALADLQKALPDTGGVVSWFAGDNTITEFAKGLDTFGANFASYYESVKGIDPDVVKTVTESTSGLVDICKQMKFVDSNSMYYFTDAFNALADIGIDKFVEAFTNSKERVETVANDFVNTFNITVVSQANKDKVKYTFETLCDSAYYAVEGKEDSIAQEARYFVQAFVDAAAEKNASIITLFKNMTNNGIRQVKNRQSEFKDVGKMFVDGFISGINENKFRVDNAAKEIGSSALKALKESIDSHSPSKETARLGSYFGEGFIDGVNEYIGMSEDAGSDIGTSATDALREALEQSASLFDTSIDLEPTIKPVVDLTDVIAGAEQINGIFDTTRSVSLAGSVSAAMNESANIQNSITVDNSDVIKSIDNLNTNMLDIADRLSKLEVRMDTGALVGELVAPMDSALGSRTIRRGRG